MIASVFMRVPKKASKKAHIKGNKTPEKYWNVIFGSPDDGILI